MALRACNGRSTDKIRNGIFKVFFFKELGLDIKIKTNLKE